MNQAQAGSKKLLYVAPFCHIPPTDGGSYRGINLLRQLQKICQVALLTYCKHDADALQQWAARHQVMLYWLPDPPPRRKATIFQRLLAKRPPGFASHQPEAIAETIDKIWIKQGPFDCLYFATQLMGQAALITRWQAALVLDMYDIYTPIAQARTAEVPVYRPYHWLFRVEAARVRGYERQIVKQFDLILVLSQRDADAVATLCSEPPVAVIPDGIEIPTNKHLTNHQEHFVLMVGNYHYAPNAQGFRWFYTKVWPQIRADMPGARLCLVGRGGHSLESLTAGDNSVSWEGYRLHLGPYYQKAACAIVPIFSGGGIRVKLLEAMAWGVPVVSTTIGAWGVDHDGTVTIADTPEEFAKAVAHCLISPGAFSQQATKARQIVAEYYSWDGVGEELLTLLN
jgi:glycosyltransferase involved in cell wall biosynthesis